MITVVSLNPSIDRTLTVRTLHPGHTNRAESVRVDAGGKGINVCRHLAALGANSVQCIGIMRDGDAAFFADALEAAGTSCHWLQLPGKVRTNTKIIAADGTLTEINEPGEPLTPADAEAVLTQFRQVIPSASAAVFTGSIPPGMSPDIYAQMIAICHAHGVPCLLDADRDALRLAIAVKPDFIKPNRREAEALLGRSLPDTAARLAAAQELQAIGIPSGCISLGEEGSLCFSDAGILMLPALNVTVRSTVGAGDAMTAAFALGMAGQVEWSESFRLAAAASAAAVSSAGTQGIDRALAAKLLQDVPQPIQLG